MSVTPAASHTLVDAGPGIMNAARAQGGPGAAQGVGIIRAAHPDMMAVGKRNLDLRFRYLRLNDRRIDERRAGAATTSTGKNDAAGFSTAVRVKRGSRSHLNTRFAFTS